MLLTFLAVLFCWVFFRASSLSEACTFLKMMAGNWGGVPYEGSTPWSLCREELRCMLFFLPVLLGAEWINRRCEYALERLPRNVIVRYVIYYVLILSCIFLRGQQQTFIYFQF